MKDKSNREIKHIRFSITSRCNYNCIYCDKEGFIPENEQLSKNEIIRLTKVLGKILNAKRIKFTGGEPLCRKNITEIIHEVKNSGLYDDISITTNGYFLYEKAEELKGAGLDRVNVSLSSLRPDTYETIYGRNGLEKVLKGIKKAKQIGLYPIKLNFVALKGVNDEEIPTIIDFCGKNDLILQLIQLHSRPELLEKNNAFFEKYFFDIKPIINDLEKEASYIKVRGDMQNRKVFIMPNSAVVETVIPSHDFCMGCTKLRVGCDGNIFGCLFRSDLGKNVKETLKESDALENYKGIIKQVVDAREPYY